MKKFIILSTLVLALASCSAPATPAEETLAKDTATVVVVDSASVKTATVAPIADTTKK